MKTDKRTAIVTANSTTTPIPIYSWGRNGGALDEGVRESIPGTSLGSVLVLLGVVTSGETAEGSNPILVLG